MISHNILRRCKGDYSQKCLSKCARNNMGEGEMRSRYFYARLSRIKVVFTCTLYMIENDYLNSDYNV